MKFEKSLQLGLAICGTLCLLGCDKALEVVDAAARAAADQTAPSEEPRVVPVGASREVGAAVYRDTVRIASFNIQAFGQTKLSNTWAMQHIAAIVRQFDIVAIQEIRSQDQTLMDGLLKYVNAEGGRYNYLLGERLGRTSSKEQYAYVFNTQRLTPFGDAYTVRDDEDWLHREPYVARFTTTATAGVRPFTFTLANVHTDPDEVPQELQALARVYQAVAAYEAAVWGEDDFIMLGDFNADAAALNRQAPGGEYSAAITREATNVAGTAQYDNALLSGRTCTEFTGRCGVLDFPRQFNLSAADAKRISDHLPVWCEFTATENPSAAGYPTASPVAR